MHAERVEVPPYVLADDYERLLSELREMRQSAEEFLADYVYSHPHAHCPSTNK